MIEQIDNSYVAHVIAKDGTKVNIQLMNADNFLGKVDSIQKGMGVDISKYVPIEVQAPNQHNNLINWLLIIGAGFFIYQQMK